VSRHSVQISSSVHKSAKIIFKSAKPTSKFSWSKKAKLYLAFFKNEKYSKKLNKAKNYKPGLKKAKLATLLKTPHDTAPSVKHAEQHVTLFPVQKSCFPAVGSLEPQPVC